MEFIDIGKASVAKGSILAIEVRDGTARDWTIAGLWLCSLVAYWFYTGHFLISLGLILPILYVMHAVASKRIDVFVRTTSKGYLVQTFRLWNWEKGDIDKDAEQLVTELKAKMAATSDDPQQPTPRA